MVVSRSRTGIAPASSEMARPTSPTMNKMMPMVLMSKPFEFTSTAQARMAPAAMNTRLVPIPVTRYMRVLHSSRALHTWSACDRAVPHL
jgi:hypothetical protein